MPHLMPDEPPFGLEPAVPHQATRRYLPDTTSAVVMCIQIPSHGMGSIRPIGREWPSQPTPSRNQDAQRPPSRRHRLARGRQGTRQACRCPLR
jgi:hypothetical protein